MEEALRELFLLHRMPMYFNGLVVENTSQCTAKCGMCYQSSGPKGSDISGLTALTVAEIEPVIREAIKIENLQPRFHLTGGEAFLNIDDCIKLFEIARSVGYLNLSSTTNGFWAKNKSKAQEICDRICDAGVTNIELSWDYWHLDYISPEAVSNCLDACYEAGIETNLRLLATKPHSYEEALSHIRPESLAHATCISGNPVFPTGRATTIDPSDFYHAGSLDDNCHSFLNLTVNALGNIYPCCAGLDQTNLYVFGNIRDHSITDVATSMNQSPMLRTVVFQGISALIPILERKGIEVSRDTTNICSLCWSIFSRPECVAAIKEHFSESQIKALQAAIYYLEHEELTPKGERV
jgi:MoaA/NifB/PqqE/SkfB family radical SAM enzyme